MKSFNKVITVEVSVDTIANNLLETIHDSHPHREMIVETIIGSANVHQLGLLYNSLNGFTNEINFKIGDIIVPKDIKAYGYWEGKDQPQSYNFVQEAKIIEIDIYAKDKIKIEYILPNGKGVKESKWISHIGCELIVDMSHIAEALAN